MLSRHDDIRTAPGPVRACSAMRWPFTCTINAPPGAALYGTRYVICSRIGLSPSEKNRYFDSGQKADPYMFLEARLPAAHALSMQAPNDLAACKSSRNPSGLSLRPPPNAPTAAARSVPGQFRDPPSATPPQSRHQASDPSEASHHAANIGKYPACRTAAAPSPICSRKKAPGASGSPPPAS